MKGGAGRSHEVFEFKEEDELPDIVPSKFLGRLKNTALGGDDAILKYNYLGFVSDQISIDNKVAGDIAFVDVDSIDTDHGYDGESATLGQVRESYVAMDNPSMSEQCNSDVLGQKRILADLGSPRFIHDQDATASGRVETSAENPQLSHDAAECIFHTEDKSVDSVVSDSEERISNSSPADFISNFAGDSVNNFFSVYFGGCTSDPCSGNQEIATRKITVHPDFVALQGNYMWDAEIRFSSSSIQLTGLNAHGGGTAWFEWSIDNIVTIEAQWHERVETAVVLVHVISEDSSAQVPSGVQEIKFTLSETDWVKEQEHIMSLDERYKPLCVWNDANTWHNRTVNEKRIYFPVFNESFDELVYPKDDSDPVTVSKRDIDLLQPETFINDTIIDFYVKYLKDRLEPQKAERFHFFNSFFFRKLADLERNQFDVSDGRASFLRVRKWTRKVNLFEKDYIFIPVNSNLHWSLIVICHPGEIAKFEDKNANINHKVPCILHMDSIKGSHTGLKNHLQSYLWEEWKEKQNEETEEIYSKFFNLRFISLEVPQQENSYDCGLFLLHYVELFLEEAPESFNPFQITKYSNFLNVNWFPPGDVSIKRGHIQRIIYEINTKCIPHQQRSPCESYDHNGCEKFPEQNNGSDTDVELVRVGSSPPESCSRDLFCEAAQEIERSTLASTSARNHFFADESGLELEFHDQGTANGLLNVADGVFNLESSHSQLKSCIASVEENARNDDHFECSLVNGAEFTTQADQVSFQLEDYRMQSAWSAVHAMQAGVEATGNFECSRLSRHEPEDAVIVGEVGNSQVKDTMVPIQEDRADHHVGSSPLTENFESLSESPCCPSPAVQEAASIKMPDDCVQLNHTCSITEKSKAATLLTEEDRNGETSNEYNHDAASIDTSEREELRVFKRARVEPLEEEKYLTRSNSTDFVIN
uniref:Ubiquitin-like protease family profile domain-containing protein n=1 Tax=Kalanchoe fedtschenkoi TaxID=63787 RepID=A0A7N1A5E1_KALFE